MPEHETRNVLTVFIASPGDVGKERKAAREVVNDVNKILRTIDWSIDLRGWEDTTPGIGRPQEIINTGVRDCDLFLGLLYARWGTPTGTHTSGFEEEYRLAMKLRKEHGQPEIWLFFKRINDKRREDPGDELKKVSAFRKEIEQDRELLYKEIKNSTEWPKLLSSMLLMHILERHRTHQIRSSNSESTPLSASTSSALVPSDERQVKRGAPPQLATALASAEKSLEENLSEFQAARLSLFAAAAVGQYQQTLMGIHEVNILYRYRRELDATPSELDLLRATVVGQRDDVAPGWYWLSRGSLATGATDLLAMSIIAGNEDVRTHSASLLADAKVIPELKNMPRATLAEYLLKDTKEQPLLAKIEYIARVGIRGDLPAIDHVMEKATTTIRANRP